MAENEVSDQAQGAFISNRLRNPAEMVEKKGSSGDVWAGVIAIIGFVVFAATVVCMYLDMTQLTGM